MLEFKGSWDEHLPFIVFAYNNRFYKSIEMVPFDALYGRWYRSSIGEMALLGQDLVMDAMGKMKLIREKLKMTQSHQMSYPNVRKRNFEFNISD